MRIPITFPEFELAVANLTARSASNAEKQAAAWVFLKYLVGYLTILAAVGFASSMLVGRFGSSSPIGFAIAVTTVAMAITIMIVFVYSVRRGIVAQSDRKPGNGY